MPQMINPFDVQGGFNLADMTDAINILPNQHGEISGLGLFRDEPIVTTTAILDVREGFVNLLPAVPRGGPATVAKREPRSMRAFVVPHLPHDDGVLPTDIQGIRQFGTPDALETLTNVMNRKLQRMKDKHQQTLEFMRLNALKGLVRDGTGATLVDIFAEFGVSQPSVNLTLGTAGTDVPGLIRQMIRDMKRNLTGENMSKIVVYLAPTTWDKFIKHQSIKDAYANFQGLSPFREQVNVNGFPFQGVEWREYDATFSLADGTTEEAIAANDGFAFPFGTRETFTNFWAPANHMETVNTLGRPFYSWQSSALDGRSVHVHSESNPLPLVKRPKLLFRVYTSN